MNFVLTNCGVFSDDNEGLWKDGQADSFDEDMSNEEDHISTIDEYYSKHCSTFLDWGKSHAVSSGFAPQASHTVTTLSTSLEALSENKSFPCDTCGKVYKLSSSLYSHKKFECGKVPAFKCVFCPQRTYQKGSMKRHMKRIHNSDATPLNISVCDSKH